MVSFQLFLIYLFTVFQSLSMHNGPRLPLHQHTGPCLRGFGMLRSSVGAVSICPATRTFEGLRQPGQARGKGRPRLRDPPRSGTLVLTFTQRHKRAAEVPSPRMEEQPRSRSPESALQQWKIFSVLVSEERPITQPTWLRQVPERGAASKCSIPVPSGCIHSPSSLEKNLSCPSHPLAGSGHSSPEATKPTKGHVFMPWGDDPLCLRAGIPQKPTS